VATRRPISEWAGHGRAPRDFGEVISWNSAASAESDRYLRSPDVSNRR
jgi:hypothetical protein